MRPWVILLWLSSSAALAENFDTASSDDLRARRCWEKTALALMGASQVPGSAGAPLGSFRPEAITKLFGANPDTPNVSTFPNRFAAFVNAKWQREQSSVADRNAPYFIARHVLANNLPWRQTFLGRYDLDFFEGRNRVVEAPNGLGYFRIAKWLEVYAGNEAQGYKLSTAYRIMNNVVGVKLTPAPNNTAVPDSSATGRAAPGCTGCHFAGPFPLDTVARVLTRRVGTGAQMTFTPPTDGPQVLWGHSVSNDEELVTLLVNSEQFTFNTCQLVFEFLYGRTESTCEAPLFDACVAAFEAEGTIQAAAMAIIRHPEYCR